MVPLELEDQSQEEDNIPLLEGFQWESLMDVSTLGPSRKRSLSESSLAPPSAHSLLIPQTSKQTTQKEVLCSEQQGFAASEKMECQQELEQGLGEGEEKLTSLVSTLQRCDSLLGDSSSGTELCDGQGTGKRRRAAGVSEGKSVVNWCIRTGRGYFLLFCRMLQVQRSPAWNTITNEGRSDLKKVGSVQDY